MTNVRSAKIICAPAGWGKTHYLLAELKEHLRALRGESLFRPQQLLVVPYREQARRLKDLLLKELDPPALFSRSILSYSDLVERIFPELGGISQIQRRLILTEILETLPLRYYGSARDLAGFTHSLSEFISEWKGFFLGAEDFAKALKAFAPGSASAFKIEDLETIFHSYQKRTEALGMMDYDDSFRTALLRGRGMDQALSGIERISFDGFYDFLPGQLKLLERLKGSVPEIAIYITHEEGKREALFNLTHNTLTKLEKIGFKKEGFQSPFSQNYRALKKDLLTVERYLFSDEPGSDVRPAHIQIFEGVGLRGEVNWIARELLRLKRGTKFYWSDAAILLREVGEYGSYIREIFAEYGIPCEIHERRKLRENPWVRHLLDFFRVAESAGRDPELFFNFLRSSYLSLSREAVIDFEQFSKAKGFWNEPEEIIDYLTAWLQEFKKEGPGKELQDFIHGVLKDALSLQKRFSLAGIGHFFEGSLEHLGNFSGENFKTSGSREDYEAHRTLLEILTEIGIDQEGRGKTLDFSAFFRALIEGVELSLFSVHGSRQDAVQVYSVQLARQKEYRVVFVSGLLQKNFPGTLRESPVLKDAERERLAGLGFEPRLARSHHERYYFYLAVTRARERLYLTYPRFDLEGKEALPSFFVEEVTRLFKVPPQVLREDQSLSIPRIEGAVSVRDMKNFLAFELGEARPPSTLRKKRMEIVSLYNFLLSKKVLAGLPLFTPAGGKDVRLTSPEVKRSLRSRDNFSPTALETYGGCSIRYFFSKVLRLVEPNTFDSPQSEGTLLHELLSELVAHPETGERLRQRVEEKVLARKHFRLKPYEKRLTVDVISRAVSRVLEKEAERLAGSPFRPKFFEKTASFGQDGSPQGKLELEWRGERYHLIGEMDRVDVNEATGEAVIVDYKRGKTRSLKVQEIEEGTHLQLPLYGAALKRLFDLDPVAYVIYSIKGLKPSPVEKSKLGEETFHRLEELVLDYAGRYVSRIRKGEFRAKPVKCPDTCPFPAVCRFERWRAIDPGSELEKEPSATYGPSAS